MLIITSWVDHQPSNFPFSINRLNFDLQIICKKLLKCNVKKVPVRYKTSLLVRELCIKRGDLNVVALDLCWSQIEVWFTPLLVWFFESSHLTYHSNEKMTAESNLNWPSCIKIFEKAIPRIVVFVFGGTHFRNSKCLNFLLGINFCDFLIK